MAFDSPSATPASRNSGNGAADLAAAFRHMSATRDAACSSLDRERRHSPQGVAAASPLLPQFNTRASLGRAASPSIVEYPWSPFGGRERTIRIGSSSNSRSVSPPHPLYAGSNMRSSYYGTAVTSKRDGGLHLDPVGISTAPPSLITRGLGPATTTDVRWQSLAQMPLSYDAMRQTRNVRIGGGASAGPSSPPHADGSHPPLSLFNADPNLGGPVGNDYKHTATFPMQRNTATNGAEALFAGEEDAFDRDGAVLHKSNQRGASPRVYAPEFEDEAPDFLLPQPDAVVVTQGAGTEATPHLDAFARHELNPSDAWGSARHNPTTDVASPPPKPPLQQHLHSGGQRHAHVEHDGGSLRHTNSMTSMATSETQQAESAPLSRVPSMMARSMSCQYHSAVMDFNGIPVPVPPALAIGGGDGPVRVTSQSSPSNFPFNQQKPSKFLSALVEAVALRKQARLVPAIPSEVVHAFDSIVRDGAYFVKYTASGAPHERFFQVRFVDVQGRAPEPCLSWGVHRTSWSAKGVLNLAAIASITLGVQTAAFRRHLMDDRRIRGPMIGGPHRAVLPTSHAFSLESASVESEPLSILSLNAEVYEAWVLFLSFIVSVGTAGAADDCVDGGEPVPAE